MSKAEQKELANATHSDLEARIQNYMNQATEQQDRVKQETSGGQRAERGVSKFLNTFNGYFQA